MLDPLYFPCQVSYIGRKSHPIRTHLLSDIEKVVASLRALIHAVMSPSHGGMLLDVSKVELTQIWSSFILTQANFSSVCYLVSFSDLLTLNQVHCLTHCPLRDDGKTLLHGLQQRPPGHPQDGHLKVFWSRHICSHRPQCHHYGNGVLYDAWCEYFELSRYSLTVIISQELEYALKLFNYFFTGIFIVEAGMKVSALGLTRYLSDRYIYNCQIHVDSN